jgi:hypothetical protein
LTSGGFIGFHFLYLAYIMDSQHKFNKAEELLKMINNFINDDKFQEAVDLIKKHKDQFKFRLHSEPKNQSTGTEAKNK